MTIEEKAKQIMIEYEKDGEPVTFEEAMEVAEMELGEKAIKNVNGGSRERKKSDKPKTVKVSDEKVALFNDIDSFLRENYNISVLTSNKKWEIIIGNKHFSLDLVEHRTKK